MRNLERIAEKKFQTYEAANAAKGGSVTVKTGSTGPVAKTKIFARNDGTFDVVWYQKIATVSKEQVTESMEKAIAADKVVKVHGLKSKDRKKPRK